MGGELNKFQNEVNYDETLALVATCNTELVSVSFPPLGTTKGSSVSLGTKEREPESFQINKCIQIRYLKLLSKRIKY